MPRVFHIPGVIFLFCAFILLILVSISLPFITALDVARVHFKSGSPTVNSDSTVINELRFGTWATCWYEDIGNRVCSPSHNAYATTIHGNDGSFVNIGPSWTRGLAIHPVGESRPSRYSSTAKLTTCRSGGSDPDCVHPLALLLTMTLLASLTAFLAALITLIAFAVDIALYAFVKHEMGKLNGVSTNTDTAPGFWLTFVSFLLLCFAGCTVCFGRRRDRLDGATTYSWRDRFRLGRKRF
ncbi:hypothetical protein K466DRAFT_605651 [Polyporus arcularius HHB13444]|uniref:Pali-domain-containing protein n=1 Tax=Polyporus arcularius HHB13444 TaxID=1314778 RepID=A0A5C3NU16_9APHY|nr:hypothetical protein K466DRAFT_605651 [Polyporus arcularius HHB13444]